MKRRILAGSAVVAIVIAGCTNTAGDPTTTTVATTSAPATTAPTTTAPPTTTVATASPATTSTAAPEPAQIEPTVVTTSLDDPATITLTTRDGASTAITFPFEASTAHDTTVYSAPDYRYAIVAMSSLWLFDRATHEFEQLEGPYRLKWFRPHERFAVTTDGGRVQVIDLAVGTVIDVGKAFKMQDVEMAGHRIVVHLFDENPAVAVVDSGSGDVVTIDVERSVPDAISDTGELLAVRRISAGEEQIVVSPLDDPTNSEVWFESYGAADWAWEGDRLVVATRDGELHLVDSEGHEPIGELDVGERGFVYLFSDESASGVVANLSVDEMSEWFFIDVEQGSVMPISEASGLERALIEDPGHVVVVDESDEPSRIGAIRLGDGSYVDLAGPGDSPATARADGNGGLVVLTSEGWKLVLLESGRELALPDADLSLNISSPDGETLAHSFRTDGVWTTRLYDIATGELVGEPLPGIVAGWL